MRFHKVVGQTSLKKQLMDGVNAGRIPHAQLFLGKSGSGTLPMALAYALAIWPVSVYTHLRQLKAPSKRVYLLSKRLELKIKIQLELYSMDFLIQTNVTCFDYLPR